MLSFAFSYLITVSYWKLFFNELMDFAIFSVLAVAIWQIIKYGNYSALSLYQRIINYTALGILTIGIWLALGFGLFYFIFSEKESAFIVNTLWIKGFIGALMYLLLVQYFYYQNRRNETMEAEYSPDENELIVSTEIMERIAVKSGQKIHVILVNEITYLQAEGDYVRILTEKGKYLKEETMKFFQEHLPQKQFVRIHRSYIVNVEMIQRIDVYEKQNQLITLKNGEKLKASAAGYKQLKLVLNL